MSTYCAPPIGEAGSRGPFGNLFEPVEARFHIVLKEKQLDQFLEQERRVTGNVVDPVVPGGEFISDEGLGYRPTFTDR